MDVEDRADRPVRPIPGEVQRRLGGEAGRHRLIDRDDRDPGRVDRAFVDPAARHGGVPGVDAAREVPGGVAAERRDFVEYLRSGGRQQHAHPMANPRPWS